MNEPPTLYPPYMHERKKNYCRLSTLKQNEPIGSHVFIHFKFTTTLQSRSLGMLKLANSNFSSLLIMVV